MEANFVAHQHTLSMSDCERMCGRTSREIGELARHAGWEGLASHGLSASVGMALDVLFLSECMIHGVELHSIAPMRHGVRTEALLKLGSEYTSWSLDGSDLTEKAFWPLLWDEQAAVRPRIARLLKLYPETATRKLRYHSQAQVERVTNAMYELGQYDDRAPRFTLDAHELAARLQSSYGRPLFSVSATAAA